MNPSNCKLFTIWWYPLYSQHLWRVKCLVFCLFCSGVNFINILWAAFMCIDPQKCKKKTDNLTVFFALSGSEWVKPARKILVKSMPQVNFINILHKSLKRHWQPDWVWGATGIKAAHKDVDEIEPCRGLRSMHILSL